MDLHGHGHVHDPVRGRDHRRSGHDHDPEVG